MGGRLARTLTDRMQVLALTATPQRVQALRAQGITPLEGNLDEPASLRRLAGLATRVVHLAPPAAQEAGMWWRDPRTQSLVAALRLRRLPLAFVYASSTGVYGNCGGAWVAETRPIQPRTPRAQRRADAERWVRHFGRVTGVRTSILRIPGIYARDRAAGTPRERLLKQLPVLREQDDVYTNHIHADDLARAVAAALWRGAPQRAYNANDDTVLKMGDYFDLAADLYRLPRPARIPREGAEAFLPLSALSFMDESRRLDNSRLKKELRLRLKHPTVHSGL